MLFIYSVDLDKVKISTRTCIHKSHLHSILQELVLLPAVSDEYEIISGSGTCVGDTQWENVFTRTSWSQNCMHILMQYGLVYFILQGQHSL